MAAMDSSTKGSTTPGNALAARSDVRTVPGTVAGMHDEGDEAFPAPHSCHAVPAAVDRTASEEHAAGGAATTWGGGAAEAGATGAGAAATAIASATAAAATRSRSMVPASGRRAAGRCGVAQVRGRFEGG